MDCDCTAAIDPPRIAEFFGNPARCKFGGVKHTDGLKKLQ